MQALTWFAIMLVLVLPVLLVWYALVEVLVRIFGIRVSLNLLARIRRKAVGTECDRLTRVQYVMIYGVLAYGLGTAFLKSATDYVAYKFSAHSPVDVSHFLGNILLFASAGIFFGYFSWNHRSDPTT